MLTLWTKQPHVVRSLSAIIEGITPWQQHRGNLKTFSLHRLFLIAVISAMSIFALFIQPTTSLHAAKTMPFADPYSCAGDPANASTASNVCHSLAISRNSYFADIPTTIYGGGAQIEIEPMNYYQDGTVTFGNWITNEVKLADTNGNYEEAGMVAGFLAGGAWHDNYFWADERPEDNNTANYHIKDPVLYDYYLGSTEQVDIVQDKTHPLIWYISIYGSGHSYVAMQSVSHTTGAPFSASSIQMGTFLIGTHGMYALPARFGSRYYVSGIGGFHNVNLYHEYQIFVDQPPYMYHPVAGDTDFSTYCCTINQYGTLQTGGYSLHNTTSGKPPLAPNYLNDFTRTTPENATPPPSAEGFPAIRANDGTQATTKDSPIQSGEVVSFVQGNAMPYTIAPKGNPHVLKASLISSKQISTLLKDETTGFADDKMLWFAEVNGTFNFPNAKGPKDSCHHGYEVFDPATGNLVMFGGMS